MDLSFLLSVLFATLTIALARQEPQIAPQQQVSEGRAAPLLGVRYSASTDVSHTSYSSPLVTYGDSLNDIQLPAAPIQPANLRQVSQEDQPGSDSEEETSETFATSGNGDQTNNQQLQALHAEPQNQVTQAIQPQSAPNQQQFISVQQYPARPQLRTSPRGFSLSQNLPGPQIATRAQYQPAQSQPQYAQPQQYNVAQPQPADVAPQQQPIQYQSPVSYSSPSSNTYFATGPFARQYPATNLVARQYPTSEQTQYAPPLAPQYSQPATSPYAQPVAPQYAQPAQSQYAQPVAPQYAQQVQSQYAQPVAPQYAQPAQSQYAQSVASQYAAPQYAQQVAPQYAQQVTPQYAPTVAPQYAQQVQGQYAQPVATQYAAQSEPSAQVVAKVSFSSPVAGFSYGF